MTGPDDDAVNTTTGPSLADEDEMQPPPVPARTRRKIIVQTLRYTLLALVILAAVWQVWVNWNSVVHTVTELQWPRTTLAFLAILPGIFFSVKSWLVFVDDLGAPIGLGRGAQISLVGALGKYLPGSVWAYVLQIELGRQAGLSRARVFSATLFNLVVVVVAALVAGSLAVLPLMSQHPDLTWLPWLYLALPLALAMLYPRILSALSNFAFKILRRPRPDHPIRLATVAKSLGYALLTYVCYGVHLWLLADTRQGLTISPLALCIGTMALGMVAGLVAFLLPSGIGAREFVIIAAIAPLVGVGPATAYAAVSRLMFVVADLLTAGVAALIAVIVTRRRGAYHSEPGLD